MLGSHLGGMEAGSYKHSLKFILQVGSRQLSRSAVAVTEPLGFTNVNKLAKMFALKGTLHVYATCFATCPTTNLFLKFKFHDQEC